MLDLLLIAFILVTAAGCIGSTYLRDYELKEVKEGKE
jgi:hypothetical protein